MMFVAIFLLFLSPVLSAAADIYVSSSDGINNTSCWTGGVQTPCATLDLAIQGASARLTAVQRRGGGGNESGIVIYLLPGTYTATVLEQQLISNNVSIISMRNESEQVRITVPNCGSLLSEIEYDNCPLNLNVEFINNSSLRCPPDDDEEFDDTCNCEHLKFTANVTNCRGKIFHWKNQLEVCDDFTCTNVTIKANKNNQDYWEYCYCCSYAENNEIYPDFYYELPFCYDNIIGTDPIQVTFSISTTGPTYITTKKIMKVKSICKKPYTLLTNGTCELYSICSSDQKYCPYAVGQECIGDDKSVYNSKCFTAFNNSQLRFLCTVCHSSDGVPINKIKECVNCDRSATLVFIGIELLPMTIIVLLIIAFNIQLTNGSINGLVFYSQIVFSIYSDYAFLMSNYRNYQDYDLFASPCNIFNLDFTPFLGNYSLCIAPHMSPLGAISFWYVVGFYPLLLLLLLYVWITLYDKGYKCVVFVTRPFHRCMARFWSMTGIEPSFTHSIASIYILCFTQLATTSFKILRFQVSIDDFWLTFIYFYDANQKYFKGAHMAAVSFAVLVLLVFILLPTLYILFYRFKWFHKLLDCLHLRKQLLISLGDVFTGPYKNGTNGTYDYRFFAGFHLLLRLIVFFLQFTYQFTNVNFLMYRYIAITQGSLVLFLVLTIVIFRPFQRDIHNFCEVMLLILVIAFFGFCATINPLEVEDEVHYVIGGGLVIAPFNGLLFFILLIYIIIQLCKMIMNCYKYHKLHNHTIRIQEQEDQPLVVNDDDWIADRMENPQEYDEQHVPVRLDDLSVEYDPQDNTVAANYGSINNNKTVNTNSS